MSKRKMPHRITALFIAMVSFASVSFAQSPDTVFIRQDHNFDDSLIYSTDTIVFESGMRKQILIGTTILPSTHNQMMARSAGLYLSTVTKTDCQTGGSEKWNPNKINSIIATDTSLIVDINITDNCCYEFLCDVSFDSTGTLNLIYYGYGTYCACNCCYGLTFHFEKFENPDYSDIKAVMINDDRKTLLRIKE